MEFIKSLGRWGDPYDREARLYPGLIVVLPLFVVMICIFGVKHPVLISVSSILMLCGGPLLVARIARDLGKSLEDKLFIEWGGKPTTIMLRHENTMIDSITKSAVHACLSKLLNTPSPSKEQEQRTPDAADEFYRAGTAALIRKTQDTKKFSLLFKENKNYGFQRNLRGLKWIGIALNLVLLVAMSLRIMYTYHQSQDISLTMNISNMVPALLSTAFLLYWIFLASKSSVRRAADAYADRLIRSCDQISLPRGSRATGAG